MIHTWSKKITLLFTLFILSFSTHAQADGKDQHFALSLELLGHAGLYSVNADYTFGSTFAIGAGYSTWSASTTASAGNTTSTVNATVSVIPVYANIYLGKANARMYLTGGESFVSATVSSGALSASGSGNVPFAGLGFEYRNGFLFRLTPYVFFGDSIQAWGGLSFGAAF